MEDYFQLSSPTDLDVTTSTTTTTSAPIQRTTCLLIVITSLHMESVEHDGMLCSLQQSGVLGKTVLYSTYKQTLILITMH